MAVAEIIGAAVGVLLLITVAYLLVGGTLSAAETVANAQKDLTITTDMRIHTGIALNKSEISNTTSQLRFSIANDGKEIVRDYAHMDIYTYNGTYGYYIYDTSCSVPCTPATGHWAIESFENDIVHPKELDPGEKMWIIAAFPGEKPQQIVVSTSNGVTASALV